MHVCAWNRSRTCSCSRSQRCFRGGGSPGGRACGLNASWEKDLRSAERSVFMDRAWKFGSRHPKTRPGGLWSEGERLASPGPRRAAAEGSRGGVRKPPACQRAGSFLCRGSRRRMKSNKTRSQLLSAVFWDRVTKLTGNSHTRSVCACDLLPACPHQKLPEGVK